jgi:dATP pyrophosphohydrolase
MPTPLYDMISLFVFRRTAGGAEFLLLKRAADRYMGGTWQPVSGGIHPGESASDAALRELREETGLSPLKFYQTDSVQTFYMAADDVVRHCPTFAAETATDAAVKLNNEHVAFEWVPAERFIERLMCARTASCGAGDR